MEPLRLYHVDRKRRPCPFGRSRINFHDEPRRNRFFNFAYFMSVDSHQYKDYLPVDSENVVNY